MRKNIVGMHKTMYGCTHSIEQSIQQYKDQTGRHEDVIYKYVYICIIYDVCLLCVIDHSTEENVQHHKS